MAKGVQMPDYPVTRKEKYLAKAAGQEVVLPEYDKTREEAYMRAIAENGGSGGDVTKKYVDEQVANVREDIPTVTSELTNDSNFVNETTLNTALNTKEEKAVVLSYAEYQAITTKDPNKSYYVPDAPLGFDDALSATSDNAVQNKVLTAQFNIIVAGQAKQNAIANHTYEGEALTDLFATEIQSDYDNPWQWITARNKSGNWNGMNVADFIPFTTTNGVTLNAQIAGINTYKNYSDSPVGAHIDFICRELWPTLHPINKINYNNGTADQQYPWLASDLYLYLNSLAGTVPSEAVVGGGEGTAVDYTADGVYYFLPTQLKNVIIEKKFLLPTRYSASGLLTDDNSWAWKNIGKLWLPDECEVYGMPVWGGKGGYSLGGSGLQYPLFAGNMNRLKFRNGSRDHWWLLSPYSGDSTYWCGVYYNGACYYDGASCSGIAAPVCFRTGETYSA